MLINLEKPKLKTQLRARFKATDSTLNSNLFFTGTPPTPALVPGRSGGRGSCRGLNISGKAERKGKGGNRELYLNNDLFTLRSLNY